MDGSRRFLVWISLGCVCGLAVVCAQLAVLSSEVSSIRAPLETISKAVEPQTTATNWKTRDGQIVLLTTRRGEETVREWIERHAMSIEQAQLVSPDMERDR